MRIVDLIEKKRDGLELNKDELAYLIKGYVKGDVPDYQMSAFLMAVYFNGMTQQELTSFNREILFSGDTIDLSQIEGIKIDKHSTGGVGDKTSLVLGPLVAACGGKLAKLSGRGLGHTGGTLDKLEAIDGFQTSIELDSFFKQVNEIGVAIVGQTKNLVPADKLLYALRDVTATVNSIPLIASSIMSKKLASGADKIVLDVKLGSGAFMETLEDARELAKTMVEIGKGFDKEVVAYITNMDQVLGEAVGNALEVQEAIETLQGNGPKDFTDLVYALAEELLTLAEVANPKEKIAEAIHSGEAYNKFLEFVQYQGGDLSQIKENRLPKAKEVIPYYPKQDGYISKIDTTGIGHAAMLLGAGRASKADAINLAVGLVVKGNVGDAVSKETPICYIHTDGPIEEVVKTLDDSIVIGEFVEPKPIVIDIVR